MLKGLFGAVAIVSAGMIVLPALIIWAAEGGEWFERLRLMTPVL